MTIKNFAQTSVAQSSPRSLPPISYRSFSEMCALLLLIAINYSMTFLTVFSVGVGFGQHRVPSTIAWILLALCYV
ncbi:MAG: hypothetical protein WCH39_27925, partial [Schlesneria sp.]